MSTTLNEHDRQTLLDVARNSIAHGLEHRRPLTVNPDDHTEPLRQTRATFVTLQIAGRLRGCIGMLNATRPLVTDVAANAFAAAMHDPRFSPLSAPELDNLDIHISVLSPSEPIEFKDEADLLTKIRPNIDGLILEEGPARGTFLPSVWEQLPTAQQFLAGLKRKAGLLDQYWSRSVRVRRYTTESFP